MRHGQGRRPIQPEESFGRCLDDQGRIESAHKEVRGREHCSVSVGNEERGAQTRNRRNSSFLQE